MPAAHRARHRRAVVRDPGSATRVEATETVHPAAAEVVPAPATTRRIPPHKFPPSGRWSDEWAGRIPTLRVGAPLGASRPGRRSRCRTVPCREIGRSECASWRKIGGRRRLRAASRCGSRHCRRPTHRPGRPRRRVAGWRKGEERQDRGRAPHGDAAPRGRPAATQIRHGACRESFTRHRSPSLWRWKSASRPYEDHETIRTTRATWP